VVVEAVPLALEAARKKARDDRSAIAREEISNWQSEDAQHRAAKSDVSHKDQAIAETDSLFFKKQVDT